MGLMDSIEQMAANKLEQGSAGGATPQATTSVANGLVQTLDEHPGGLSGLIQHFQQNGMGQHVQNWASGQQQTATPEQVQQGMQGTGLIDKIAARAGVSPEITKIALATVLPMVISHFTQGNQQQAPSGGLSGMLNKYL